MGSWISQHTYFSSRFTIFHADPTFRTDDYFTADSAEFRKEIYKVVENLLDLAKSDLTFPNKDDSILSCIP